MAQADTAFRAALRAELERQARDSRFNATAHSLLANVALLDGRQAEARRHLRQALESDPFVPRTHQRLGDLALELGDPREALREYAAEKYLHGEPPGIGAGMGAAHEALGELTKARDAYRAEVRRHPEDARTLERLRAVESKLGQ
jgi:tetratricopeptide (TPR) repeat protein